MAQANTPALPMKASANGIGKYPSGKRAALANAKFAGLGDRDSAPTRHAPAIPPCSRNR